MATNVAIYEIGQDDIIYAINDAIWYGEHYYGSNIGDSDINVDLTVFAEKRTNDAVVIGNSVAALGAATKPPQNVLYIKTPLTPLEPADLTAITTPADGDHQLIWDVSATEEPTYRKVTWANIKATLKAYFDTLYNNYVHPNHSGEVTSVADGAQTIANSAVTLA